MKTIYDFKKGDEIVRVQPSKLYPGGRDSSFIGEKLIFVEITNGVIFCQRTNEIMLKVMNNKLLDLELNIWDEGWDYF